MSEPDLVVPDLVLRALAGSWHPNAKLQKLHFVDVALMLGVPTNVAHAAILAFNATGKRRQAGLLRARARASRNPLESAVWLDDAATLMEHASKLVASCMDVLGRTA